MSIVKTILLCAFILGIMVAAFAGVAYLTAAPRLSADFALAARGGILLAVAAGLTLRRYFL